MSPRADRSAPRRRRAPIALALGGCGGTPDAVGRAVSSAARVSTAAIRLFQNLMRSWCPKAVAGGGRRLTEAQARGCLRHAWDTWLRELRRDGYDPTRVGR